MNQDELTAALEAVEAAMKRLEYSHYWTDDSGRPYPTGPACDPHPERVLVLPSDDIETRLIPWDRCEAYAAAVIELSEATFEEDDLVEGESAEEKALRDLIELCDQYGRRAHRGHEDED